MQTLTRDALAAAQGTDVVDQNGDKIGSIEDVYYDDTTGQAEWVGIGVGIFGLKRRVVPVAGASMVDDRLQVAYDKDRVKNSPDVDDDEIGPGLERELYTYYGVTAGGMTETTGTTGDVGYADRTTAGAVDVDLDRDTATTGDRDVVRSEEELRVGKENVEAGRVRLRKWVETEQVERDVDLRRETAEIRREPIDQPVSGAVIGEDEIEVTLHEERPVVEKDVVARERISLDKDVETNVETVSDEVRRERVEVEGDVDDDLRRGTDLGRS